MKHWTICLWSVKSYKLFGEEIAYLIGLNITVNLIPTSSLCLIQNNSGTDTTNTRIMLLAKWFIYKNKQNNGKTPTVQGFKLFLNNYHDIERAGYYMEGNPEEFESYVIYRSVIKLNPRAYVVDTSCQIAGVDSFA